jgi:predicted transcriptional regulator
MAARQPPISETEMDVLKVLWEHGPATVRAVNAVLRRRGRRYAYTTVLTLLQRLQAKGHVTSDKGGVAHVFAAAVSRDGLLRRRLDELADELCDGTATPLVQALVAGRRFTPDDVARLRRLLDEMDV